MYYFARAARKKYCELCGLKPQHLSHSSGEWMPMTKVSAGLVPLRAVRLCVLVVRWQLASLAYRTITLTLPSPSHGICVRVFVPEFPLYKDTSCIG